MSTRFFPPVDIAHVSFVTNSNYSFGPTPEKTFNQIINSSITQLTTNKNQEPLVRRAIWALIPTSTCQICRRNDLCSTLFCLCFRFQWQMPRSLRVNIWLLDGWHSWKNLSCIVVGHKRVDMNSICNRGWKTSTQFVTAGEKKVQVEDEASSDQPLIILRFYSNPTLL